MTAGPSHVKWLVRRALGSVQRDVGADGARCGHQLCDVGQRAVEP
jgi:hypothetical protein